MNCGRGSVHVSWSWLSSFPSFFGFIPSSRAICTCSCDKWNLRRASIQGCKFGGTRGCFFAIDTLAQADRVRNKFWMEKNKLDSTGKKQNRSTKAVHLFDHLVGAQQKRFRDCQ